MSKLRRRLARQHLAASTTGSGEEQSPGAPTRQLQLDQLRARLATMMGDTPPPPPRKQTSVVLPFDAVATQHGELHVRQMVITPAQRLGTVGLAGAIRADPRMLSLLALTPRARRPRLS